VNFLQFSAETCISRVNCVEITGDRPFSALNVDPDSVSFDSLGYRSPAYVGIKFAYPVGYLLLLSTNLS